MSAGKNHHHRRLGSRSRRLLMALVPLSLLALPPAALGEVRFGNNVRIGGHDASNQTFNRQRRGHYVIHEGKPAREGCRWVRNRDGSRTKLCHLQRRYR